MQSGHRAVERPISLLNRKWHKSMDERSRIAVSPGVLLMNCLLAVVAMAVDDDVTSAVAGAQAARAAVALRKVQQHSSVLPPAVAFDSDGDSYSLFTDVFISKSQ